VDDERLEVVGEAFGGGGVAGLLELVDQALESLLSVALAGGVIECLPVGPADAVGARPVGAYVIAGATLA
jgi:hypothetical protein